MKIKNYYRIIIMMVFCVVFSGFEAHSQQIYATTATKLTDEVDGVANAEADNGSFATVKSYGGLVAGLGSYDGSLKLEFQNEVPANTTTYIRVGDAGTGLLDLLLGGSLGELLSNVVGSIILGDHFIEVSALDSSDNNVVTGRSDNITSSTSLKVVRNKDGETFFAITPDASYKSVVIKDNTRALLLGTSNFINVYHAFYLDPAAAICNPNGIFTSFDGSGISLDLLNLGGTGVTNPEYAIDDDETTYSEISVGIVSALASMSQEIQFPTVANTSDQLEISIRGRQGALVNVAVFQNISIDLYNGDNVVYSSTASGANLLTILPSVGEILVKYL